MNAAGISMESMADESGNYLAPHEWLRDKQKTYMLQVSDGSMIGAAINHGDYVVIDPEQAVNSQDIGAVYYNGATTLKRIVQMGDTVLLMSENPDCEPIHLSQGDFKVMGKLVGVIKKL